MSDVDFTKVLNDAGIPTTEADLEEQWKQDVLDSGSSINNDSKYSSFWRISNALVTTPALWLINFVITTILPNVFLKYATGTYLDLLADAVNLTRKIAVAATGTITFTRADVGQNVTIPVDTVIQTAKLNDKIYKLKTTVETSFAAGEATVEVPVTAVEVGADFNLATGYYSILLEPIGNIVSVVNSDSWLITPGADVESDESLRARCRNQFGTASDYHTDSVYKALIAKFPGVDIDAIWFTHDAPRGPGTANAYILFDFASPVAQYLTDINTYITDDGNHGHGDDLQALQMPEQNKILVATVWHDKFLTADEITTLQNNVDSFIKSAFRENIIYTPTLTYPYKRFSFSRLGGELDRKFSGLQSVDFDLPDIVSALWIPRLSALTVNMQVTE